LSSRSKNGDPDTLDRRPYVQAARGRRQAPAVADWAAAVIILMKHAGRPVYIQQKSCQSGGVASTLKMQRCRQVCEGVL
jgi:hypothetical protein